MARQLCRLPIRRRMIIAICALMILTGLGCSPERDETTSDGGGPNSNTQIDLVMPRQVEGPAVSEIVCVVVRVTAPDLDQPRGAAATVPEGAASIELALDVPVGADRQFEAEAFAEAEACDMAADQSFVPNFIPLFQNDGVVTADVTSSGTSVLIPMVTVTGLVARSPAPPIDNDGETVSLQVVARDPSEAPLMFSATGLPPGLRIDAMTGVITGTLSRDASVNSPYSVTTTVSNGPNLASVSFLWTVINPPPVLTLPFVPANGAVETVEGDTIDLRPEASDPDLDSLTFSASTLPPGLAIDAATGVISGTLTNTAAVGSPYTINVTVSDGLDASSANFTLTVANPAPVVTSPGDQAGSEGATVSLQIEASDPDGDTLMFSATGLPPDLGINPATGLISGTLNPTASTGSPYAVTVEVSDGAAIGRTAFTWDVAAVVPTISIADRTTEENDGAGVVFTVSLSVATGRTVTVDFSTADDSATAGSDYEASSGTLTFAPGVTTQTLTVPILDDGLDEPSETFVVNLSNPVNGTLADGQGVGTIQDDDELPTLSINDVTVAERGGAVFTVSLSAVTSLIVTVDFSTANDSAIAGPGLDYRVARGTLTFAPGVTTQMLRVPILEDTLDEPSETFVVNLSNPVNSMLADGQGVGTIQDDDATPTLSINNVTVPEGNSGTTAAMFTVTLSAPSGMPVSVRYDTANGTATAGQDYQTAGETLTFARGETTQMLSVTVLGDIQLEPNETFTVNLSNPVGATIAAGTGTGTITNDDTPLPQLSINDVTIIEGNVPATPSAMFTVTLTPPSTQTVTVDIAASSGAGLNPATAGIDFQAMTMPGQLTFPPNTPTQPLSVLIIGDQDVEPNETFVVTLSNPINATIADGEGTGTITNDDTVVMAASQLTNELWRYDGATGAFLDVLVADDPATLDWDESGGLRAPGSLLLSRDDRLYVASQDTGEILSYDAETGIFLGVLVGDDPTTQVNESGGLQSPGSMLLGPANWLYVVNTPRQLGVSALSAASPIIAVDSTDDQVTDEILRYDARTGQFIDMFIMDDLATLDIDESGGLQGATGLVMSPSGQLYISSFHTNQILRYDGHTGVFLGPLVANDPATPEDESGGLQGPAGLVIGPDGYLYVSSFHTHEILRYDGRTGVFIDTFISATNGGLESPSQLLFGPDDRLYVSQLHTGQVLHYERRTGAFLGVYMLSDTKGDEAERPASFVFRHQVNEDY